MKLTHEKENLGNSFQIVTEILEDFKQSQGYEAQVAEQERYIESHLSNNRYNPNYKLKYIEDRI